MSEREREREREFSDSIGIFRPVTLGAKKISLFLLFFRQIRREEISLEK